MRDALAGGVSSQQRALCDSKTIQEQVRQGGCTRLGPRNAWCAPERDVVQSAGKQVFPAGQCLSLDCDASGLDRSVEERSASSVCDDMPDDDEMSRDMKPAGRVGIGWRRVARRQRWRTAL